MRTLSSILMSVTLGLWLLCILILLIFGFTKAVKAAEVTLQWNPVTEATGYKIYHGNASRVYGIPDDVLAATTYTLTLGPGEYYFAVTAYNNYGESGYSEEVSAVIGEQLPPTAIALSLQVEGSTIIANWVYPPGSCEINSLLISLDDETPIPLAADIRAHSFTGLPNGPHTVQVTALNEFGETSSNLVSADVAVIPGGPEGFSGTIELRWNNGCTKTIEINGTVR